MKRLSSAELSALAPRRLKPDGSSASVRLIVGSAPSVNRFCGIERPPSESVLLPPRVARPLSMTSRPGVSLSSSTV
jgi:hypothetical protein